jgi:hypothetical protein
LSKIFFSIRKLWIFGGYTNKKALVALILLVVLLPAAGAFAYSEGVSVQDSNIEIRHSNITICDSNVTIINSTIIVGEGNTIIYSSDLPAPSSTPAVAPEIKSVSPISSALNQTITIQGTGFGDIQPRLLILCDGSVDTVWGDSTPSIVIYDKTNLLSAGAAGDWPGFTNGPPDHIGIVLLSWSDTQIVLGGFGTGLGSRFSWSQVEKGDAIQVQVRSVGALATFDTIAA